MPAPPDLPERLTSTDQDAADLAAAITHTRRLPAAERAREARRLVAEAEQVLSRLADAAVVEATGSAPWADVAAVLGTSTASVGKAIRRYKGQRLTRGGRGPRAGSSR